MELFYIKKHQRNLDVKFSTSLDKMHLLINPAHKRRVNNEHFNEFQIEPALLGTLTP